VVHSIRLCLIPQFQWRIAALHLHAFLPHADGVLRGMGVSQQGVSQGVESSSFIISNSVIVKDGFVVGLEMVFTVSFDLRC
jgi:hypothetical protein